SFATGAPPTNLADDTFYSKGSRIHDVDNALEDLNEKLKEQTNEYNELLKSTKGLNTERKTESSNIKKTTKELKTLLDVEKEYNDAIDLTKRKSKLGLYENEISL